jgi:hypothetical protein
MERVLTIKGSVGKFDVPHFLSSDNEGVTITLSTPEETRIGVYRLVVRHGNAEILNKSIRSGQTVYLSPEWIKSGGNENVEFSLILVSQDGARIIKDNYKIEPLKIESVNGNFSFCSWVEAMAKRCEELDKRFLILQKRVEEYEKNGIELISEEN